MPKKHDFPPAQQGNESDTETDADRQSVALAKEEILQNDPSMRGAIDAINWAADHDSGDKDNRSEEFNDAKSYIDSVDTMLMRAENSEYAPGDEASDELKLAWKQHGALRAWGEEAAHYADLNDEDKKALDTRLVAYRQVMEKMKTALNEGNRVSEESLLDDEKKGKELVLFQGDAKQSHDDAKMDASSVDKVVESTKKLSPDNKVATLSSAQEELQNRLNEMESSALLGYKLRALERTLDAAEDDEAKAKIQTYIEGIKNQLAERLDLEKKIKAYEEAIDSTDPEPNIAASEGERAEDQEEGDLASSYSESLDKYATMKAQSELRGERGRLMSWIHKKGDEKRSEEFDAVEGSLKENALAYAAEKVKQKLNDGEYTGTEEEIKQQMSDDTFNELRRILDTEVRAQTDKKLEEAGNKWHNRVLAKIGSWITKGDSRKDSLKAGAAGFGVGAVKGAAAGVVVGMFGASWPISMAAGAGFAVAGNHAINKGIRLDEIRNRLNGDTRVVVDDEEFNMKKQSAGKQENSQEWFANSMIESVRNDSLRESQDLSRETKERRQKHKVALGIGLLAGGAVGGAAGRMVGLRLHDAFNNSDTKVYAANQSAQEGGSADSGGDAKTNSAIQVSDNAETPHNLTEVAQVTTSSPETTVDFSHFDYPWNWASDQFGPENATAKLHELAANAASHGHNVQWHGSGVNEWVSIDGNSDTQSVLSVLSQYNK